MEETLEYYFIDGRHIVFDNLTIDFIGIVRDNNGNVREPQIGKNGYERITVSKEGKRYDIRVNRAVATTFFGKPPSSEHTADHGDRNRRNNALDNISWKTPSEQNLNQDRPDTYKSAFIVVKDGVEKTAKEWVTYLEGTTNPYGRAYTVSAIKHYAQRKQHGFAYKVYEDLPGEIWKEVPDSNVKISNKQRVKRTMTSDTENVLDVSQLSTSGGYPMITINGEKCFVHHLCLQVFSPDEYNAMNPGDVVRHKHDDRLDFRPEKLLSGSRSQNMTDAHDNGKYDGKKKARKPCVSYVDGVKEPEHNSLHAAVRYLKGKEYPKASRGGIYYALKNNTIRYGRTWKLVNNNNNMSIQNAASEEFSRL